MPICSKYRFVLLLVIGIVAAILGTSMMRSDVAQAATKQQQNRYRTQASASQPVSTDSGQDLQNQNSQNLGSQDQNEEPADGPGGPGR